MAELTVTQLQVQNKQLKAEYARLKRLEKSLDKMKRVEARASSRITEDRIMQEAFKDFDSDSSGMIEKDEIAVLAASLGELWEDHEVEQALKAMDTSVDGKVSYEEFSKWWKTTEKPAEKSRTQSTLLRTKLAARYLNRGIPDMLHAMSEKKLGDGDDWINYNVTASVGDVAKDAKSFISLEFDHAPVTSEDGFDQVPETGVLVAWKLRNKPGVDHKKGREEILNAFQAGVEAKDAFAVMENGDSTTLLFATPSKADPFAAVVDKNLDIKEFISDIKLRVDLGGPFSDFIDETNSSGKMLSELMRLRLSLVVKFRKALIYSLMKIAPALATTLAATWLEEFSFRAEFGEVSELIRSLKSPQGFDPVQDLARSQEAQLEQLKRNNATPDQVQLVQAQHAKQMDEVIAYATAKELGAAQFLSLDFYQTTDFHSKFRHTFHELCRSVLKGTKAPIEKVVDTLKAYFEEVTQVEIVSKSGFRWRLSANEVFPFKYLPKLVRVDGDLKIEE